MGMGENETPETDAFSPEKHQLGIENEANVKQPFNECNDKVQIFKFQENSH